MGPQHRILQLNVDWKSNEKCSYLERLLKEHRVTTTKIAILQETHVSDVQQMTRKASITSFTLVSAVYHRSYDSATYVKNNVSKWNHIYSKVTDSISVIAMIIAGVTILITNIYKPPNVIWPTPPLPTTPPPSILISNFNSHHTDWEYKSNDENGAILSD